MYIIKIKGAFEAAHQIVGYSGKCQRLHGHNWKVEVSIKGETLNELGMLIDFKEAKKALAEVLEPFDHRFLNELPDFQPSINPTSEHLVKIIFSKLSQHSLFLDNIRISAVTVWETSESSVTYTEG